MHLLRIRMPIFQGGSGHVSVSQTVFELHTEKLAIFAMCYIVSRPRNFKLNNRSQPNLVSKV